MTLQIDPVVTRTPAPTMDPAHIGPWIAWSALLDRSAILLYDRNHRPGMTSARDRQLLINLLNFAGAMVGAHNRHVITGGK